MKEIKHAIRLFVDEKNRVQGETIANNTKIEIIDSCYASIIFPAKEFKFNNPVIVDLDQIEAMTCDLKKLPSLS